MCDEVEKSAFTFTSVADDDDRFEDVSYERETRLDFILDEV